MNSSDELNLANHRLDIKYNGINFYGWQRHKDKPTIQGAIENAVTECFGIRQNAEGSGRTDRGAHANCQIATIKLPENIDLEKTRIDLNNYLSDIKILKISKVQESFHARDSAVGKRYIFKIWNNPILPENLDGKVWFIPEKLNVKEMKKTCPYFKGETDFASFAKVPNFKRATSIRNVYSFSLTEDGDMITFAITANGFLYKMVRNIIRAVVKVGEGRTPLKKIPEIIKAKNRNAAPGTAPASGLYLDRVFYDVMEMERAIKEELNE